MPDLEDAEVDQPPDLSLGHPGEVGQSRRRQRVHTAVILGAVPPSRRGSVVPGRAARRVAVEAVASRVDQQAMQVSSVVARPWLVPT